MQLLGVVLMAVIIAYNSSYWLPRHLKRFDALLISVTEDLHRLPNIFYTQKPNTKTILAWLTLEYTHSML